MMSPKPTSSCKENTIAGMTTIKSDILDQDWKVNLGVTRHITHCGEILRESKVLTNLRIIK